jgi:hypothetical protein
MKALRLTLLVVIAVLALAACGGGSDLTEEQIENAFKDTFAGNTDSMKEITCDAEHEALEAGAGILPEGSEVTIDCSIDGDVATCSGSMSMVVEEGADPVTSEMPEFKVKIEDGKLCGTAE